MTDDTHYIRVDHVRLRALCNAIQIGFGVPGDEAQDTTDMLVESNLMGIDTHGVIRLKMYMDRVENGGNRVRPEIRPVREAACTALLEGDNCMGAVGGKRAMDLAIAKAQTYGVGVVVIRNCNHYGPAGYWSRMALAHDMIGISLSNTMASMPPTGGAAPRQGNDPYSVAFPTAEEPPVVVDGCASVVSWGKLLVWIQSGQPIPPGCLADKHGNPTVDPDAFWDEGMLVPIGGHKGYGLAVAIELLTGMLGDHVLDHDIPHAYKHLRDPGAHSFLMAAMRVDHFCDAEGFKRRLDEWVRMMRATPRAPDVERIWLPGEMEHETRLERLASGIPLHTNMIEELRGLAQRANVAFEI